MELRDRTANLAIFGAAIVAWLVVAAVVLTRDPLEDPSAGFVGAALMGLAVGLTTVPLFWLAAFARHGRIALRGDWTRAIRRGCWVAVVVAVMVVLRLQDAFQWPIALFVIAMVVIAEVSLSVER
ncbi:MAG TPA: hypothetical protein VIH00_08790 [Candidatus Limnocylindrales bacterium]